MENVILFTFLRLKDKTIDGLDSKLVLNLSVVLVAPS